MPLTYDLSEVKDRDLSDDGWALTQALIFATMAVGINEITEANADEFYARVTITDLVGGPWLLVDNKRSSITVEDVQKHVGLRTNASPLTRTKFLKQQVTSRMNDLAAQYRRATQRAKEGATDGG